MSLSVAGLKLLQYHELWVGGDVYTDPNGHQTIGYGHFVKPGEHFGHLTHAQGLALLAKDAQTSVNDVNRLVKGVTLTQTEFDAIVDFEFNIGDHHFANSTLLQDLNAGNFDLIKTDFMQWTDHGAGYAKRRREDDIQLFDNGIYVYR